ncbi:heparinase II/III family protein [Massilia sp. P8910]|uniref:heparinase II/III domain-containing protein n=1 Tax=Massilia antarctica TaxID=2765360 RepID=UPI001E399DE7|nr:heparinase II/III family protein [Massilia antarctica]MCE3605705.1 heparinase II/III family protein [Massilia antarctica]
MSLFSVRPLPCLLFCAGLIGAPAHADWAASTTLSVVRPAPAGDQVQGQNPPGFAWSQKSINSQPASGYEVEVTGPGGATQRFQVSRNWLLPEKTFAPGSYTWRVRAHEDTEWTDARTFRIDASGSLPFIVPSETDLKKFISARGAVRSLPPELLANPNAPLSEERMKLRVRLQEEVTRNTTNLPVPADANWPLRSTNADTKAYIAQAGVIRNTITPLARQLESAALLWRLHATDKPDIIDLNLEEAIRRGNQLAALHPDGPTSYREQDQATRVIALSLIKAIDLLGPAVEEKYRKVWLDAVQRRGKAIYDSILGSNGKIDQYPFDSHGGTNYGMLAAIATLGLDRVPDAGKWFDFSLRGYANSLSPWGGDDGGFANGTAYAEYSEEIYGQLWQPIAAATGVNLFRKPWAIKFAQFMAHFDPPGSPTHVFGDEHDVVPVTQRSISYGKSVQSPVSLWYANSLVGKENALFGLQAPAIKGAAVTPAAPANAAQYPSIGWVAMHSKITDPVDKLTSVYFKSSPYGSYNHGHADQNSLVINSGGGQLLVEAGKADYYGSEQAKAWYRQTRAHNAITYDGGIGQELGIGDEVASLGWNGAISNFSTSPTLDTVTGTATAAYKGALSVAVRQVWYLREKNMVVVRDKLSSPAPRIFEWNMHSLKEMLIDGNGKVRITGDRSKLCLLSLTGSSFERFPAPSIAVGPKQFHAAFKSPALASSAEFIVVLDIGCKGSVAVLGGTPAAPVVTIDGQPLRLY